MCSSLRGKNSKISVYKDVVSIITEIRGFKDLRGWGVYHQKDQIRCGSHQKVFAHQRHGKSHFPGALYQLESLMLFLKKSIVASSVCKKSVSAAFLQIPHSFGQLMVSNRNSQQGVTLCQKCITSHSKIT